MAEARDERRIHSYRASFRENRVQIAAYIPYDRFADDKADVKAAMLISCGGYTKDEFGKCLSNGWYGVVFLHLGS